MELYGTFRLEEKFRNFVELYNRSDGTEQLWLVLLCLCGCSMKASVSKFDGDIFSRLFVLRPLVVCWHIGAHTIVLTLWIGHNMNRLSRVKRRMGRF